MSKKILLVEDDPFLKDIYTTKLKEEGFVTLVADNGKLALDLLKKEDPDLMLLDIVLPEVTGWELLSEIKKNKKFKNLPVIILSNLGQKQEVSKGIKLGAARYLIKAHYTPSEVIKEVKKTLNG